MEFGTKFKQFWKSTHIRIVPVSLMPLPVAHWRPGQIKIIWNSIKVRKTTWSCSQCSWKGAILRIAACLKTTNFFRCSDRLIKNSYKSNLLASLLPLFLPKSLEPLRLLDLRSLNELWRLPYHTIPLFIHQLGIGSTLSWPTLTKETYLDLLLLRRAGGLTLLLAPPTGLLWFNHPKLHLTP